MPTVAIGTAATGLSSPRADRRFALSDGIVERYGAARPVITFSLVLFWISIAGLAYIFVGYPVLIWFAAKVRPHRSVGTQSMDGVQVAVLIAAHNETDTLATKLRQLIDEPRVGHVHVGVDGATASVLAAIETVRLHAPETIVVHPFEQRRGKPAVLSDMMPHVTEPITVMADARQRLGSGAIEALVQRLADPTIGVVSGELIFEAEEATSSSAGVGAYWRYEKLIRNAEGRFRSVPGATGALYAIRTDLMRPIAENTLLDDVVIPMQAIERGARCVFEPAAVVYDRPTTEPGREAIRKRRTIAGAAQLVLAQPRWLLPWRNPIWWEFCSHKLARLLAPLLLAVALITNGILAAESRMYLLMLAVHLAFYAIAGLGYLMQRLGRRLPGAAVPLMFVTLNGTTALAVTDAVRGRFTATWKR